MKHTYHIITLKKLQLSLVVFFLCLASAYAQFGGGGLGGGGVTACPPSPVQSVSVTNNCGNTVLTVNDTQPDVFHYWQTSAGGTSFSTPGIVLNVTSGTTRYVRAYNFFSSCWGPAITVNYNVIQPTAWYEDADGDGLGDPNSSLSDCSQPAGYVANANDACPTQNGQGTTSGCPPVGNVTLSNDNYVFNRVYQSAMTSSAGIAKQSDVVEQVTYMDGLGRGKQTLAIKQSPNEQDIISHMEYDALGRQQKEYLPFVATHGSDGSYRSASTALSGTNAYYTSNYSEDINSSAPNPYSETLFEASPLNRPLQQAAPGYDWRIGGGHEIEFDYLSNTATEVKLYTVDITATANSPFTPTLVDGGLYAAGELMKTVTYDENHTSGVNHSTEEFKDKEGRVVLKRTYNAGVVHDTYYVYDDDGNLTYVLPPKSEAQSAMPNATQLDELCYQYVYDLRNRLVEKKIPGKGWEYIVYNKLDQPVLTQDANLRANNQWLFTKYDPFRRVAYTGIMNSSSSRNSLQNAANTTTTQYVTKSSGTHAVAGTNTYYAGNPYPTSGISEVYTLNYYDGDSGTFNFHKDGLLLPSSVYGQTVTNDTKGLPTGSKVRVLGTSSWITTITGYDAKGRAIYVASKNSYLNTTDSVESKLDFAGKMEETKTTHIKTGNAPIVIVDQFFYDHATRLVKQTQQINNGPTEVIVENVYDEIGQLVDKGVGGNTTQNRLQNVDYRYNIRGWLKEINDVNNLGSDLFSFRVNYNEPQTGSGATALFNGNISETLWNTANDNSNSSINARGYQYDYDDLNRITKADYKIKNASGNYTDLNSGNYRLRDVTYDKNGNIMSLKRSGSFFSVNIDDLTYAYDSGNKLLKVDEHSTYQQLDGFRDGTNTGNDYTYDANGNMKTDANKGITNINYNHLNLPTFVNISNNNTSTFGGISYIYDATGVKQRKIVTNHFPFTSTTTDYAGNFVYENSSLKFFNHPEGYVEPNGSNWKYVYQCKDHLGNVRLTYADENGNGSVTSSEIREENNYYPFGLKHKGYNDGVSAFNNGVASRWKYNSTEFEESLGLNLYEMELRQYDPTIARWTAIDPVTHHSMSTYMAFDGNPVYFADPSGADSETFFKSSFLNANGGHWTDSFRGDNSDGADNGESSSENESNSTNNLISDNSSSISDNGGCDDCSKCPETCPEAVRSRYITVDMEGTSENLLAMVLVIGRVDGPLKIADYGALIAAAEAFGLASLLNHALVTAQDNIVLAFDANWAYAKQEKDLNKLMTRSGGPQGMTYALVANQTVNTMDVRGNPVTLNAGDVWKYGKTTIEKRYTQKKLDNMIPGGVRLVPLFFGDNISIRIQEKIMIYGHYFANGSLPPGNHRFY